MPEIKVYVNNETYYAFLKKIDKNQDYRKDIVKMIQEDLGIKEENENE